MGREPQVPGRTILRETFLTERQRQCAFKLYVTNSRPPYSLALNIGRHQRGEPGSKRMNGTNIDDADNVDISSSNYPA